MARVIASFVFISVILFGVMPLADTTFASARVGTVIFLGAIVLHVAALSPLRKRLS